MRILDCIREKFKQGREKGAAPSFLLLEIITIFLVVRNIYYSNIYIYILLNEIPRTILFIGMHSCITLIILKCESNSMNRY